MIKPGGPLHLLRVASPVGRLELISDGRAIVSVTIERDGRLPQDALPDDPDELLDRAAAQLAEYFAGARRRFDIPVETGGTAFQRAVWQQLAELDWGAVTTYGALGRGTGHASAGRAVGRAIGANPVPILIPCHRVLGSDGRVTGYSAGDGIPTKLALLELEGIVLAPPALLPAATEQGAGVPAA
ncbi:MAG: methylated-DNA--[protein]-cysteine S-methyltransferase [Micrococcales bacterium]|nr:methylated-DNA--[protein]-cysteine S-methyltransferase [Micrococcales bacterium]